MEDVASPVFKHARHIIRLVRKHQRNCITNLIFVWKTFEFLILKVPMRDRGVALHLGKPRDCKDDGKRGDGDIDRLPEFIELAVGMNIDTDIDIANGSCGCGNCLRSSAREEDVVTLQLASVSAIIYMLNDGPVQSGWKD